MASSPTSDAVLVGVPWTDGAWTSEPVAVRMHDGGMDVTAREGSDAWRITSYGFVHDTQHALLAPLAPGTAVEVAFTLDLREQFDQAGVFVRVDAETWIKAGVERSDGEDGLGAVVTRGVSDWSLAPVPGWSGRLVTIRASRSGDALTVRARVDDEPWRLVRVAPLDPDATASAGPFCCAPTRAGFTARFASWRTGPADAALHA
jgi:regulation of enolase protein 1 (concanavalin A-like superfamily)